MYTKCAEDVHKIVVFNVFLDFVMLQYRYYRSMSTFH